MKTMCVSVAMIVASSSGAEADSRVASEPPGVTLELCNELDNDEVQSVVELELAEQVDRRTSFTVRCDGSRVVVIARGARYPRGRLVEVDLATVEPRARSRTVALVAAEMWTAPQPEELVVVQADEEPPPVTSGQTPPSRFEIAVGGRRSTREIFRSGGEFFRSGSEGAGDGLGYSHTRLMTNAIAVQARGRITRHLGLYQETVVSDRLHFYGADGLPAEGRRVAYEFGGLVSLGPYSGVTIDLRLGLGSDSLRLGSRYEGPAYHLQTLGADVTLPVSSKWNLRGKLHHVSTTGSSTSRILWDLESPVGARMGAEAHYALGSGFEVRGGFEMRSLRPEHRSNEYFDNSTSMDISLAFTH